MKNRNLVICDAEEEYAQALAMFLAKRKELPLQVQTCSSLECLEALEKDMPVDVLLLSEEYEEALADGESSPVQAEKICLLSAGRQTGEESKFSLLLKYQPGEKLLGELLKECEGLFESAVLAPGTARKKSARVIGVFSPVHRVGKTAYALRLGEKLAESENVLYLNLEVYGGNGGHFEEETQTISDILCYARQEKGNLGMMLPTLVCHRGNLDYIAPVAVSEDLKEIGGAEWAKLIERILGESIYETLILDIGEGIPELYQLLGSCTEIHMAELPDLYSQAKIRQFERELSLLGQEEILGRIVRGGGSV